MRTAIRIPALKIMSKFRLRRGGGGAVIRGTRIR